VKSRPENPRVAGSIPAPGTSTRSKIAVVKDSHANLSFNFAWGKASRGFYINVSESF